MAVLSGIALLNQAYSLLARSNHLSSPGRLAMIEHLADAVGMDGLVAGQELDLREPVANLAGLREAHHRKTGVLFMAAVNIGGLIGGASVAEQLALERFAAELGLAFQARDDVSDAMETELGCGPARSTLISLLGRDGALQEADGRLAAAKRALVSGGGRLEALGGYVDLLMGERDRVTETAF